MNTKEKQDLIELLVKVVTRTFGPEVTPYEKERIWLGAKHTFPHVRKFFLNLADMEFLNIILIKR